MNRYFRILFALFVFTAADLHGQLPELIATRYTTDDGLANNVINHIAQDRNGLIWVATMNGLNRFDGINFKTFKKNYTDSNSLMSNIISWIEIDRHNNVWIGYVSGGVSCYNQVTGNFKHYPVDSAAKRGLPPGYIDLLIFDHRDRLWIGVGRHGLVMLDPATGMIDDIGPLPFVSKRRTKNMQLHYNRLSSAILDADGMLWMGTGDGFYTFNTETRAWHVFRFTAGEEAIEKWKPDVFNTISRFGKDDFYLAGWGTGLNHYNLKSQTWENFLLRPDKPETGISNIITWIEKKSDHELWIISNDSTLSVFDTNLKQFLYYPKEQLDKANLDEKAMRKLFTDRNGDLWIGHLNGLNFINLRKPEFAFTPVKVSHTDNQNYYSVASVLKDPVSGATLVSTNFADGLHVTESNGEQHHHEAEAGEQPDAFYFMGNLYLDRDSVIWIPTLQHLFTYNRQLKKPEFAPQPVPDSSLNGAPYFWKLEQDRAGRYWIATYRQGLYMYDPAAKKYTQYCASCPGNYRLPSNVISGMGVDPSGNVWMGFKTEGVVRLDPGNGQMDYFRNTAGDSTSLIDNTITSLCCDRAGNVWVATITGLSCIQAQQHPIRVNNFVKGQDLLGIVVVDVTDDADGNIWFTNSKGLSFLNTQTGELRHYNHSNGLPGNYENLDLCKDPGGTLYVTSLLGYYAFHPRQIRHIKRPEKVIITSFNTGNQDIPIDVSGTQQAQVHLQATDNLFSVNFISLNYRNPGQIIYQYKLSGIDRNWKTAERQGMATYTHLPGGNYTFEVRAGNPEGQWSPVTRLSIYIATPFYKTAWFTITMAVLFALAIFTLYRFRVRSIEQTEALKTKFNKQLAETEMRALRAQMNPHFIFNCLNSINRYIIKNDHKTASLYLTKFAKLIRLILDNSETHEVALSQELEALKLYIDIEALRFDHKFSYEIDVADDLDADSISIPPMMIQPYVENAIWHGLLHKDTPGTLRIVFTQDHGLLVCQVQDDGIGREKALELKSKTALTRKSLGLKITSDRLNILNLKSDVKGGVAFEDLMDDSGKAAGTRVTVKIPIETD